MRRAWIGAGLVAGLAVGSLALGSPSLALGSPSLALGSVGPLSAQQRQTAPAQPLVISQATDTPSPAPAPQSGKRTRGRAATSAFGHDPDLDAADQLAPSQMRQPMPEAVPEPTARGGRRAARTPPAGKGVEHAGRGKPSHGPTFQVSCGGPFGKDSSHVKLAMAFEKRNVAYTQVDAVAGGKVMASVLFGKDPKRRLEVWWSNAASRSDIHLIVINGLSTWTAPGGLHLGLTLAEVERLNGKVFKLLGFNKDGIASLSNWNGGTLAATPGGCRIGVSMRPDAKTSPSALNAFTSDREYSSDDSALRTVNPTVSEILVAY